MTGRGRTAGRHRAPHRPARTRATLVLGSTILGGTAALGTATAVAVTLSNNGSVAATPTATPAGAAQSSARTSATTSTPTSPTTSASLTALRKLVSARSASSTSVAALDTSTGVTVHAGATTGMTTASAVKLQLLESLLLTRQRDGRELSDGELDSATAMIEHSDNGAAEDVFWDVGGRPALVALEDDLGLSTSRTVLGDDDYWGLTTTGAGEQLVLLRNLVDPDGPLDAQSRALALRLMRHVESDQTWGVPAAADSGTPAVKNGWLGIDRDGGLWAVNSLGVITVDGHTVLVAVLTQHEKSYGGGVQRVETLARAAAAAVVHP